MIKRIINIIKPYRVHHTLDNGRTVTYYSWTWTDALSWVKCHGLQDRVRVFKLTPVFSCWKLVASR
ncbi:hypothetical protein FDH29_gp04 [Aquamicrobium phage P14]|uniref:Uncharacterized protein n=1 Tax=Aquamicrobium phage P14 TaxID=1927013 RepID=A0A1L5C031_9CAUD|nr:hypothetical protein FDH29_gp04 [Aquamicrobium phage P14]APL99462.1 hypothetical protein BB738_0040 [Aquamicrobium phage P14]